MNKEVRKRVRLSKVQADQLDRLLERMGFAYGPKALPSLTAFVDALLDADDEGMIAIADNQKSAIITINLER